MIRNVALLCCSSHFNTISPDCLLRWTLNLWGISICDCLTEAFVFLQGSVETLFSIHQWWSRNYFFQEWLKQEYSYQNDLFDMLDILVNGEAHYLLEVIEGLYKYFWAAELHFDWNLLKFLNKGNLNEIFTDMEGISFEKFDVKVIHGISAHKYSPFSSFQVNYQKEQWGWKLKMASLCLGLFLKIWEFAHRSPLLFEHAGQMLAWIQ